MIAMPNDRQDVASGARSVRGRIPPRPNGPAVNSQGRQPLELVGAHDPKPQRGESDHGASTAAPWGLKNKARTVTRGLRPWLLTSAASRLRVSTSAIMLAVIVMSLGCSLGKGERWKFASWDIRQAVGFGKDDKPAPEIPHRLVSTWSDVVYNRAGQPSQRGFAGRITFLKNGSENPVRVDGQLVVYAFDETGREPFKTEPTKRYVYPAEEFAKYESDTPLGPSYSVWLPWDEVGGTERRVSLITRFEPKDGPIVMGEQTKQYLAGPPATPMPGDGGAQLALAPVPAQVNTAAYQAQLVAAESPAEHSVLNRMDAVATTTIPLPRKLSLEPGRSLRQPWPANWATTQPTPTAATPQQPLPTQQIPASPFATQALYQPPVPTAPFVAPALHLPASPPSGGFQSGQLPAAATPSGQ
jgi:hypothetical protein